MTMNTRRLLLAILLVLYAATPLPRDAAADTLPAASDTPKAKAASAAPDAPAARETLAVPDARPAKETLAAKEKLAVPEARETLAAPEPMAIPAARETMAAPTTIAAPTPAPAPAPKVILGPDISSDYLKQARRYRQDGRYELSRQSYLQSLATCQAGPDELATIREELGAIELLIRTMR
jgi:hypothetical protein